MKAWAQLWGLWPMAPGLSHQNLWLKKYISKKSLTEITPHANVWKMLKSHSLPRIKLFSSKAHWAGIKKIGILKAQKVPEFTELTKKVFLLSGWRLVETEGELTAKNFFLLLGQKKFPILKELRSACEVFCGSKPDLWHELVGHICLLCDEDYSAFYENLGHLFYRVEKSGDAHKLKQLEQILWVLLEYGFILENNIPKCFGAALTGSVMGLERIRRGVIAVEPFHIDKVLESKIFQEGAPLSRNHKGQIRFFFIDSLKSCFEQLEIYFASPVSKSHDSHL